MQSKDLAVGTVYAFVKHYSNGQRHSSHLGDDAVFNKRGTLVEVKGGQAWLAVGTRGEQVSVPAKNVLGTWDEHLAAVQAKSDAVQERNARQDAQVAARNEARTYLRETLGKDWAQGLPYGIDTEAEVHADRSGVHGGSIGSERFGAFTTVHLKALVEKAYDEGYLAAQSNFSTEF